MATSIMKIRNLEINNNKNNNKKLAKRCDYDHVPQLCLALGIRMPQLCLLPQLCPEFCPNYASTMPQLCVDRLPKLMIDYLQQALFI